MVETKETKRPRGRPRKERAPEVIVSENAKTLQMSDRSSVTVQDVRRDLTAFYNKIAKNSNFMSDLSSFYNPFLQNRRLKEISTQPLTLDPDDIVAALEAPQNNELTLRGAGASLAATQYIYYKILRLAADVPMYNYYKIPEYLPDTEYSKKEFKAEDEFVDEWLKVFDIKNTLKRIALEVKREGKSSYIIRNGLSYENGKKIPNFCTWQKLPSNYVKLTGIGQRGYIASFDFMLFMDPAFKIEQYPDFFQNIWNKLIESGAVYKDSKKGYQVNQTSLVRFSYEDEAKQKRTGVFQASTYEVQKTSSVVNTVKRFAYWVELPQELCYTFASDSSIPWAIPDTAGLFTQLQNLSNYDKLAGLIASTPLTAILTGEVEPVDNPSPGRDQTIMNPETIAAFQDQFNSMTSTNVEALFVPVKNMKLQSLPNNPNSSDILTKAVQNFTSMAGEGGVLVTSDKPSVAQVKAAQLMEEAHQDFVTRQFETVLNFIVNTLIGCKYKWKITLWGGIFSFDADLKRTKELFSAGATFLLPKIASAFDMNLRDIKAVDNYIKSLDLYDDFKTLTQVTQEKMQEQEQTSREGAGRPSLSDEEIENDSTAASKDSGLDTGDLRDFALHAHEAGKCMVCGADVEDGGLLCEECKEEFEEIE